MSKRQRGWTCDGWRANGLRRFEDVLHEQSHRRAVRDGRNAHLGVTVRAQGSVIAVHSTDGRKVLGDLEEHEDKQAADTVERGEVTIELPPMHSKARARTSL